jgi:hypothetical protein
MGIPAFADSQELKKQQTNYLKGVIYEKKERNDLYEK